MHFLLNWIHGTNMGTETISMSLYIFPVAAYAKTFHKKVIVSMSIRLGNKSGLNDVLKIAIYTYMRLVALKRNRGPTSSRN